MADPAEQFFALSGDPQLGELIASPLPALVFGGPDLRLLWANAAGAALMGLGSLAGLGDAAASGPARERLAALSDSLPPRASRLERLRFSEAGPRLACRVEAIALSGGAAGLLVSALFEPEGQEEAPAPLERFAAFAAGGAGARIEAGGAVLARAGAGATGPAARSYPLALPAGPARLVIVAAAGEGTPASVPPDHPVENGAGPDPGPAPRAPASEPARRIGRPERRVRFTFALDAAGRLSFLSAEVPRVASALLGQTWEEIAGRRELDPDGRIAAAIARRAPWSGLAFPWTVRAGRRVVIETSAVPVTGPGRAFMGFRGFAVLHIEAAGVMPPEAGSHAPEQREPEARPPVSPLAEGGAAEPGPETEPEPGTPAPLETMSDAGEAGTVVPLHAGRPIDASRLTKPERDAFRQIAEALGARYDGDEPEAAAPDSCEPPEPAPLAAQPNNANEVPALEPSEADPTGGGFAVAALLDRLPVPVVLLQGGTLLSVNAAFLDLAGIGPARDLDLGRELEPLLAGGESGDRLHRPDGTIVPVRRTLHMVPTEGGTLSMIVFEDLRPREAEARADAAERRLAEIEAVLDTATDGVLVLDEQGMVETASRPAQALLGYDRAEMIGRAFTAFLAPESHRAALDYLAGLGRGGVAGVLNDGREVIGAVKQGGYVPLFLTMGRLGTDRPAKFAAVLRDVTPWKKAEEELVAARRAAEAANAQKSEFLARMSHEIRTPLNAVLGFSEVMLLERFGPVGSERYREYLRDIHRSGAHITSLVNDLLDLSKIEAGKLELAFEPVDVNAALADCVALMQPQANRGRVIIRTSFAASAPRVLADRRSLNQITLNLLSNAIKFTPPGGQVIVSTAREASGEVVLRVRDTGLGMSREDVSTALEPFRQLRTSRAAEGTGLGLPLTKALVEANRAAFRIESTPGHGTLVQVTFPPPRVAA